MLRVSVVIPTYRRAALLQRGLHALLAQDLPAAVFEIVVVDDGDDDDTRRLVRRLAAERAQPRLRYLKSGHNPRRGPAAARNAGWRAAQAPVIAFTDDDTVPHPDWLSRGLEAMAGDVAAVAGGVDVPALSQPPTDHERMTQGLAQAEFVTANAFVRRAALVRVGGFDERFTRAWREDSDLQFRLLDAQQPVQRCEAARVLHPVRQERWGVSLRQQRNTFFDPLLYKKHPRRYRERIRARPPWDYYAIVALALAVLVLAPAGQGAAAATAAAAVLLLILRLTAQRLRHTARTPAHLAEMLATSALIPFLSVYWKLRGDWHFRARLL